MNKELEDMRVDEFKMNIEEFNTLNHSARVEYLKILNKKDLLELLNEIPLGIRELMEFWFLNWNQYSENGQLRSK